MLGTLVVLLGLAGTPSTAMEKCTQAVDKQLYDAVLPACIWPINKSLKEAVALGPHHYQHGFGSRTSPSKAAKQIFARANSGNPYDQFLWGFLLGTTYSKDGDIKSVQQEANEARIWFYKSADQGHIGAITYLINSRGINPYSVIDEKEKQRLLGYADVLISEKWPEAHRLKTKVQAKNTTSDLAEEVIHKFQTYKTLETDEVLHLAMAHKLGYYRPFNGTGRGHRIEVDVDAAADMFRYLFNERGSFQSAYELALIVEQHDRDEALLLMQSAAKGQYPSAVRWLGDYWACNGDLPKAKSLLHKALKLGSYAAEDSLGEIDDLGKPLTCKGNWVGE